MFEVDKAGLAKLLTRKGKEFIVYELLQNAWDEDVKHVEVTLRPVPEQAKAQIIVEDDNPDGFQDLSHAFTLFAESKKKTDPTKAGRFNLGEKLVIAACDEAKLITTKGAFKFYKNERHRMAERRTIGTLFEGIFKCTREELAEIEKKVYQLLPPHVVTTRFNGRELNHLQTIEVIEVSLPTEIADEDGYLKGATRKTAVGIYRASNDCGTLYELGIPVVEIGGPYHVNVLQKIPLNMDRDNVPPSYIRRIRVEVLNLLHDELEPEQANSTWVREASSDPRCEPAAITAVLDKRFGEKRVSYDPSDPEANKLAVSKGYVVVHGGMMNGQEWENARDAGAILPAGKVTPSPKPYSDSGKPEEIIPYDLWTPGMKHMASYCRLLADKLMDVALYVKFTKAGNNFSACYGNQRLTFNMTVMHEQWFEGPYGVVHDDLIIHEFGHQYCLDHLDAKYHDALTLLGAKLAHLAYVNPKILKPFKEAQS